MVTTENNSSVIAANLQNVKKRVADAALMVGRNPEEISLVAVSKFMDVSMIRDAYDAGQLCFGENYAQELRDKMPQLPPDVYWHMIGPLQKNKVKYVAKSNVLVESVCDVSIAEAIGKYACNNSITVPILLQVNISGEESKSGADPLEIGNLLDSVILIPGIRVCGLMTIGSSTPDMQERECQFVRMQEIFENLKKNAESQGYTYFNQLSMGMSEDFEIAIAHGATIVRVGRAIFGERRKNGI